MPEIDIESNDESKKKFNWRGAMAGGVAGAAVGGMLGVAVGDSSEALQGAVIGGIVGVCGSFLTKGQKEVGFPTGREVDFYLNANPLLKKYIQDKVDRGLKVEGNLYFLPSEEFVKKCILYLTKHTNPETSVHYTEEEAQKKAFRSNAYLYMGEIFINQNRGHAGTVIHEAIHLFQNSSYGKELGLHINEGTTEYFTRLICHQHQITRYPKYSSQYECIKKLVLLSEEDKLAEAYFQGNIEALQLAVDARKGPGTFQHWSYLMNKERFKDANKLL